MPPPAVAVCEVGSNALRLLVGRPALPRPEILEEDRAGVRLGDESFRHGELSSRTIRAVVRAMEGFRRKLERHDPATIVGVATSAVRSARNGADLVHEVQQHTDIHLRVIDGHREAELVRRAVASVVPLQDKTALLVDVGGGSVELSLMKKGRLARSASSEHGAVRLLHLLQGAHGERRFLRALQNFRDDLDTVLSPSVGAPDVCIGTGGNVRALGKLRREILGKDAPDRLRTGELGELIATLARRTPRERERQFGLKPDRADVILPAARLLFALMQHAAIDRMLIPGVTLRDGVLLEQVSKRGGG